jgi:transglutaminase-like putative cysteine protease
MAVKQGNVLTLGALLACAATTRCAGAQGAPPYAFELPIEGRGCGGFSSGDGSFCLFEFDGRQLYEVSLDGRLAPREEVKGMHVVDVAVIDGAPIYCSRDRVFRKVLGKVEVNPVPGAEKLISIAADDDEVFLLDAPPKSAILVLNKKTSQVVRTLKYDGRSPIDLAVGDGHLWVLDVGDRCIHRLDTRTGQTTLRIQAGPGVEQGTNGLFFCNGELYIHEADYARLRRVEWEEDGATVWSWSYDLRMTFVQESRNEHETATSTVTFKVPIPMNRATQTVGEVTWSQKPSRVFKDQFGQEIAQFDNIRIPPKREHVLQYEIDVHPKAVQYDPPVTPLAALDAIPPEVSRTYLASNTLYRMDDPLVRAAAAEARKYPSGQEPQDVRTLIENIATYVIGRMSYQMDDSWKDAVTVLGGNTGSCSEYSFLFSALCRLNKVPTRLVGGLEIGDYATAHETRGFHRWTDVWYPELGWVPVDVTKIDGEEGSLDYEFLFGTPGYVLVLSQGDFDEDALGMTYYIRRDYRGGKRQRSNVVHIEPIPDAAKYPVVKLRK